MPKSFLKEKAKQCHFHQECEDLMARGVTGTGVGFDAAAAGKIGGRWTNPSEAEQRLAVLQVGPSCRLSSFYLCSQTFPGQSPIAAFALHHWIFTCQVKPHLIFSFLAVPLLRVS